MIATAEANGRNQRQALVAAGLVAWAAGLLGWLSPALWVLLGLIPFTYWWVRRRYLRRMTVMEQPFPAKWEQILRAHVAFFEALDDAGRHGSGSWCRSFSTRSGSRAYARRWTTRSGCWWRRVRRSRSSGSTTGNTIGCMRC